MPTPRSAPRLRMLSALAVGLLGAWLGMALFGGTTTQTGPFEVRFEAGFGRGETEIALPPLGRVTADTHTAPLRIRATLWDVNVPELSERFQEATVWEIAEVVERDVLAHVRPFVLRLLVVAVVGAGLLGLAVFRLDPRAIGVAALTALLAVGGSQLGAWRTYQPAAFHQPTFAGSLQLAPQLVGPVEEVTGRIEDFRGELRRVVTGAVRAYTALDPGLINGADQIRVLHISDIHLSPLGLDLALQLARGFQVDFVLDTGDLTSYGTRPEQFVLSRIPRFDRPYVFVRGNHDSMELQDAMREIPNARVLDGETIELDGILLYGLGHPAFTEDAEEPLDHPTFVELATGAAVRIRTDVRTLLRTPDIVAVHDDRMAEPLAGQIPLVVSGHYHRAGHRLDDGTLFLRAGSTGGSGVNIFGDDGVPLSAQILYFQPGSPPTLVAWDRVEQSPTTGSLVVRRQLVPETEQTVRIR